MEALRKDSLIAPEIHNDFVDGQDNYHVCSFYECRPMPGLSKSGKMTSAPCSNCTDNQKIVEKSSAILNLGPAEVRVPCTSADHSTICKFPFEDQHYRYVIDEIEDLVNWAIESTGGLPLSSRQSSNTPPVSLPEHDSSSEQSKPMMDYDLFPRSFAERDDGVTTNTAIYIGTLSSNLHVRKGPFFLVPYAENTNFVGQQEALQRLKEISLLPTKYPNKVALCGLGGIGKSQIALAYTFWYQRNFENHSIFWLHARDYDQLQDSLSLVAAHCRISQTEDTKVVLLDRLKLWLLDPTNGPWLMIIDSADNSDTFTKAPENIQWHKNQHGHRITSSPGIGHYIPAPAHGKILFTTNNSSSAETLVQPEHIIHVRSMNLQDSCTLLRSQLARTVLHKSDVEGYNSIWHENELEKLAGELDCIPLALMQAAAFIRQNNLIIADYLKMIEDHESELIKLLEHQFQAVSEGNEISKAVMSTWKVAIDHIETYCPQAIDILSLVAFYDVQPIPKSLLRKFYSDIRRADEALRTLMEYCLIATSTSTESFELHRLIQLAMRRRLATNDTGKQWAVKALAILSQHLPDGAHESWHMCALLCPHALKIIRNPVYGSTKASLLGTLQSKLSWYLVKRGSYKQAEFYSRRAQELMASVPGVEPEEICALKSKRVFILQRLGVLEEAEDLAQEVWKERRETLGVRHKETLHSLALLCHIYQEQGRYVEGEKALRKIIKGLEDTVEGNDITLLAPKLRLGIILFHLGRYEEAVKCLRYAITLHETNLGHRHPNTLNIYYGLARTLHNQGKYIEAEKMNLDTWTVQRDVLGKEHPDTLKSWHEVAMNQQAQHKFAAAEVSLRKLYQQAISIVGPNHRYTYVSASSLASCLVASALFENRLCRERLAEAGDLYQISSEGLEQDLPRDHPMILTARTDLYAVKRMRHTSPLSEIEAAEREVLKKLKSTLGREHPSAIKSRENLARTLWAQHGEPSKRKEALVQGKKVLEVQETKLGWLREENRIREETLLAAEMVLEMLPEGRERQKLEQKIGSNKYGYEFTNTSSRNDEGLPDDDSKLF